MKVIAIVNLPIDIDLNKEDAYFVMRGGKYCQKVHLRPLPQKKEIEVNEIDDIMHTEYSIEDIYTNKYIATILLETDKLISLGYNACLDDIMEKKNDL